MSKGPIYIGGVSYSGKTQLRLILSKHPNIIITRRTYLWRKYYNQFGDLSQKENFERCLSNILSEKSIQQLNPDPDRIRADYWKGEPGYARLFSLFHEHYAQAMGKSRWGIQIKMVEGEADTIFAAEPDAQIIQVVRDPIDRIEESISKRNIRFGLVGPEMNRWKISTQLGQQNVQKYPDQYMFIQWEDLLNHLDETLKAIFTFLGEAYFPNIVDDDDLEAIGLRDPTTPSPSFRLSKQDRYFIESKVGLEKSYFGYPPSDFALSPLERIRYFLFDYPATTFGTFFWKSISLLNR